MTTRNKAVSDGLVWHPRWPRWPSLSDVPIWTGGTAVAVAFVALIGWIIGSSTLKSVVDGLPTMKANAAVSFLLLGAGVILAGRGGRGPARRRLGYVLAGVAVAIAAVTLLEYLLGIDLGIDQLLFREQASAIVTGIPGRMSPLTAACFVLLGSATLIGARAPKIVVSLSAVALAVSVLNVLTFLYAADVPPFLAGYSQMALSTAVAMGILAVGVMGLLDRASPFAPLAGTSPTRLILRGALALSIAAPVSMIVLASIGEGLGLFGARYAIAVQLLGMMSLGVIATLAAARWVSQIEARREAIEIERDRFFELSLDMLSVVGADGHFRRVNGAWEAALGYASHELVGHGFMEFVHPDDVDRTIAQSQRHYGQGEPVVAFQNRYRRRDGTYRWLEWMSQRSPDGSVAYAVARDVTDRKRQEDRATRQQRVLAGRNEVLLERAIRDPLTGLHNRRYFDAAVKRLEHRWRRQAVGHDLAVAVILFDLDHFGNVNKQHGHQAGDAVLRVFAGLLKRRFREQDLVARYGGEEFVVLLEGTTSAKALVIAEDIRAALERAAIDIGTETPINMTVSAGCAQLGADMAVSGGLTLADVWLSQAKRAGRNQVVGL